MRTKILNPRAVLIVWLATLPAMATAKSNGKRIIVTFKEGTTRTEREQAAKDLGYQLSADFDAIEVSVLEASDDVSPQELGLGRARSSVVTIEKDVYRNWLLDSPPSFQETPLPDVESVVKSLKQPRRRPASTKEGVPWGVARVDAPAAWPSGAGAGVKVAVIDTGIDCSHPDLKCDFTSGINIINPSSEPADDNEHGTHVSGTIAGHGDGGPAGVAPRATLIPVKVLDADGAGSLSDIVSGLDWATNEGVDVINLSLGGPIGSPALERAVGRALDSGIVVVAAAGNSGPAPNSVGFPGRYPGVIAVAASDQNDGAAPFSSRGSAVAFIAPGVNIRSTVPGGGTRILSGTSMASPHVAGLAALAIERGARGPAEVRAVLRAASSRLCPTASACLTPSAEGAGMIDAAKLR